jgi:CarD family transcriptional regulator
MWEGKVFNVGDKVIHPAYGAGTIVDIDEKQMEQERCNYYIIQLLGQAGTLMVPVARADQLGLRLPVEQPQEVLEVLTSEPTDLSSDHRKRQESINVDIRSGDVLKISEAVRDLAHRDRENSLTEADLKLYRKAQDFLAGELALSQNIQVEQALKQVRSVLESIDEEQE